MTGSSDYLPVMADCERALGRPQNALTLARESLSLDLEPALRTEMTIVAAGARADLGQQAEAVRMLREAVTSPPPQRTGPALTRGAAAQAVELEHQAAARLRYAYADALLETGSTEEARRMFAEAAKRDPEQLTDALQRLEELDGLTLDVGDLDEDELEEPEDDEAEDDESEDDEADEAEPADEVSDDDGSEDDEAEDDEAEDDGSDDALLAEDGPEDDGSDDALLAEDGPEDDDAGSEDDGPVEAADDPDREPERERD